VSNQIPRVVVERIRDRLIGAESAGAPPVEMRVFYALAEAVHALDGHDGDAQSCMDCYQKVNGLQAEQDRRDADLMADRTHWLSQVIGARS